MPRKFISKKKKRVRKGGMLPKQAERRIASNGKPLTLEEFNDYYKEGREWQWIQAERENPGKAPPPGDTNAERSLL